MLPGQPDAPEPKGGFVALGEEQEPDVERLAATKDKQDIAAPNGSSIAGILEFEGIRIFLAADAQPRILAAAFRTLGATEQDPWRVDAVKVAHHGSRNNTTTELLDLIVSDLFAFSGNGKSSARPHDETLAKIVVRGARPKILAFNYRHRAAQRWDVEHLKARYGFEVAVPNGPTSILSLEIHAE